jgi:hypothetical protein
VALNDALKMIDQAVSNLQQQLVVAALMTVVSKDLEIRSLRQPVACTRAVSRAGCYAQPLEIVLVAIPVLAPRSSCCKAAAIAVLLICQ